MTGYSSHRPHTQRPGRPRQPPEYPPAWGSALREWYAAHGPPIPGYPKIRSCPLKQRHSRLVGAVQHGAGRSADLRRLHGQRQTAEGLQIGRRKGQGGIGQQVQRLIGTLGAGRPCHGVADGQLHVRRTHLGQHGAVPVLHQRVDNALAVHHHAHLLQRQVVQA